MRRTLALAGMAAALVAGACSGGHSGRSARAHQPAVTTTTVDPASVHADELGLVPVVMYHRIVATPSGEFDRTPDDLRSELQLLYDRGFRPVRATDLVHGRADVQAGMTPVVLTFDDSTRDQFGLLPDGRVDPATAVGILLDFAATHPGFRPVATLYVNGGPFATPNYRPLFEQLQKLGFELGDHTLDHANLGHLDPTNVQRQLVLGQRVITAALPGVRVETMALPYGVSPTDKTLARQGTWDGEQYSVDGVFLVGAEPSPSPFSVKWNPSAIPRIRSSFWDGGKANFGTGYWFAWFDQHPDRRYVSDGDPTHISFPAARQADLAPQFAKQARPY